MKQLNLEFDCCDECPYCTYDDFDPDHEEHYVCALAKLQEDHIMSSEEWFKLKMIPIPDWCPLPDAE